VDAFADTIHTCVIPRTCITSASGAPAGRQERFGLVAFLGKTLNITPILFGKGAEAKPAAKTRSFGAAVEKVINYAIGRVEAGCSRPMSLTLGGHVLAGDPCPARTGPAQRKPVK